ncbi:MAG TPA: HAMP domain-containing sensor histidine kinase [Acidimicrobiales bacterium]|nr:HAMP domain-containing sensor histidine kinase [Acidimicrobiales bacterium]
MTAPQPPAPPPDGGAAGPPPAGEEPVDAIELIATVSHELRSPLTSIKGFTSLLLSRWDGIADDRKQEMLEQVRHDADRVTRMLTELLDISRLEKGRLHLRTRIVDLPALARSVVDKVALEEEALEVELSFPDDLPEVLADADKVEQVLTNLVENAAKYASPEGLRIEGAVAAGGAVVAVAVHDRGPGIPPEDLPRVFERFFRREVGRPTGTGLGLWISRGLVEAHGGTLTAASVAGQGSTFTFTLPVGAPPGP